MKSEENKKGWLDEIALKSKYSKDEVRKVLIDKYGVKQTPRIGRPKNLHILEISFSGVKEGVCTGEFHFKFKNMKPGIFGLISDINLRGKTSVLEVIKWLIRGKYSSLLQDNLRNWIHKAELKFFIGDNIYIVRIKQTDGNVSGELFSLSNGITISEFYSNEDFEECMSDFMTKEFSLDNISAFRGAKLKEVVGKTVEHGWASLASIMFISTDYKSLFGDIIADGLANRLMNLYLGLPWIPTFTMLKSIDKLLDSEKKVEKVHTDREQEKRSKRYDELCVKLSEKKELLLKMPCNSEIYSELKIARNNYNNKNSELIKLDKELQNLSKEYDSINDAKINDEIMINNIKEDMAANVIFKRLNPSCCPHCEAEITKEKLRKEKIEHICSICSEPLLESENAELLLKELQVNFKNSQANYNEVKKILTEKRQYQNALLLDISNIERRIEELDNSLNTFSERNKLEDEIKKLEILAEEYKGVENKNGRLYIDDNKVTEKKIINAAIAVTQSRFISLQESLLEEVSNEILRLSKLVGLNQIESVRLASNPSLKINKDGGWTSYSKCSSGEKLRLKVITTIALLSVAEKRQVGRHPGLLLIDSPASQEVSDSDLNSLIEGLKKLSYELPFLQVIIASRASEVILNQIDENNRKYARNDDYLW